MYKNHFHKYHERPQLFPPTTPPPLIPEAAVRDKRLLFVLTHFKPEHLLVARF